MKSPLLLFIHIALCTHISTNCMNRGHYSLLISSEDEHISSPGLHAHDNHDENIYVASHDLLNTTDRDTTILRLQQRILLEKFHLESLKTNLEQEHAALEKEQMNLLEKKMFFVGLLQIPYYWSRFLIDLTQMHYVTQATRGTAAVNMISDMVLGIGAVIFTQENSSFESTQPAVIYAHTFNEDEETSPHVAKSLLSHEELQLSNEHSQSESDVS